MTSRMKHLRGWNAVIVGLKTVQLTLAAISAAMAANSRRLRRFCRFLRLVRADITTFEASYRACGSRLYA